MWIISTSGKAYNSEVMQSFETDSNVVAANYVGSFHLILGEYKDAAGAELAMQGIINAMDAGKNIHYMYKP